MPLTLGLTGMDPATESALKAAFKGANARLGGHWQLIAETDAAHVAVDMDSMYGPMSWIRLHALGKSVIGITSAPRTQTDFRLAHPFDDHSVAQLLQEIARQAGELLEPQAVQDEGSAPADTNDAAADAAPTTPPPDEPPAQVAQTRSEAPPPEAVATSAIAARDAGAETPTPEPAAQETPPPEPRTLAEWLAAGRLDGRVRFARGDQTVLIDTAQGQYYGPATLKPLTAHVSEDVSDADFVALDAKAWAREVDALGQPMPLGRLLWFTALCRGNGTLATGFDPDGRFQMLKWPQTEREYPRHFRIATVMMKGPATLADIAESSGVPRAEVTDFVNANLATGFADIEHLPEPEPVPVPKSGGLFGRFRVR